MSNDTSNLIAGSVMLPDVQDYLAWQHPFRKSNQSGFASRPVNRARSP